MKSTRKLMGPFMAMGPFIFILAFGAKPESRINHSYQFPTYNRAQEQNLTGYRNILLATPDYGSSTQVTNRKVRQMVEIWLHDQKTQHLTPLRPAFEEELEETGPRHQIISLWQDEARRMNLVALNDAKSRNWSKTSSDFHLFFQFLDSFKYSGGLSLIMADSYEIHGAETLFALVPNAPIQYRQKLLNAVKSIQCGGANLRAFVEISEVEKARFKALETKVRIAEKEGAPLAEGNLESSDDFLDLYAEGSQSIFSVKQEDLLRKALSQFNKVKSSKARREAMNLVRIKKTL